jgi:valyl-tRNA synthetase
MDGYKTLWQPGTDHAGIATQNVVEKQLLEKGIKKEELGREKFLEKVWEWKEFSGNSIVHQMRKLGITPAWSRQRFTMDEGLKEAVKKSFVQLYDEGLITQNDYMVNWCTHDGALSDIEVEHDEVNGNFYHIKYFFEDSDEFIILATTRPETYFGDTAVMVHPDDERYKHLIGKKLLLPIINKPIEIIADSHVDMEFGTGVVKVTPAHDPNDYEVGHRHNLEFIKVFDEKGILNSYCGEFEGLERLEARKPIVDKLQELGYIEKIEELKHQVGHCYRCKNIVEPFISKQWFVDAKIADKSIQKTNDGETHFHPPHWINSYNSWMGDLRNWCISRQLWWGHRIPVFYCDECGHQWATSEDEPKCCPKCNSAKLHQDPDVLDTWFSSGLWAFSPLGWGNNGQNGEQFEENDLSQFYPNSLLITGFDILFFWVARMMMMGEHFMGELPFKDIYLHALVRDENGQKMSKSKGNVIDPLDVVEEFSADIVRFTLAISAGQGRDIRLGTKNLEQYRNFTNKLYNASNYLLLNIDKFEDLKDIEVKTPLGIYMQTRLATALEDIRTNMDGYRFNDSASAIYRFVWNEFCDWGIELSKADKESVKELGSIFKETLKTISPFMPFISEYLYQRLSGTELENSDSIMVMKYPENIKKDAQNEKLFDIIQEAITAIRRAKVVIDMGNQKIAKAFVKLSTDIDTNLAKPYIQKLAKVEDIEFVDTKIENAVSDVSDNLEVFIPTDSLDLTPIINRLNKQKEKLEREINKLNGMLNNEKFVANAPAQVLETNKQGLADAQNKMSKIEEELNRLS